MVAPTVISSANSLTAWRDACRHILQHGNGFNLLVCVQNPLGFREADVDELVATGFTARSMLSDVTNTIFPYKLFKKNSRLTADQLYDLHEEIYNRGRTMHPKNRSRWGTYFLRFTRFGKARSNQLKNIIDDINSRRMKYAACYMMHVSSIDLDKNTRNLGGPCLQYVQFADMGEKIDMTAVYRNHDFQNKALGNYMGLSRLLEFVCEQTEKSIGTLTCHSIHYYIGNKRKAASSIEGLSW